MEPYFRGRTSICQLFCCALYSVLICFDPYPYSISMWDLKPTLSTINIPIISSWKFLVSLSFCRKGLLSNENPLASKKDNPMFDGSRIYVDGYKLEICHCHPLSYCHELSCHVSYFFQKVSRNLSWNPILLWSDRRDGLILDWLLMGVYIDTYYPQKLAKATRIVH